MPDRDSELPVSGPEDNPTLSARSSTFVIQNYNTVNNFRWLAAHPCFSGVFAPAVRDKPATRLPGMSYHDNGRWYIKGWPDKRIDKYGGDVPKVTFRIDFEADDKTRGRSVASFAGHLTVEQARFVAQEIADAIVEAETGKRPVHPTRIITLVGERGGVP